MAGKRKRTRRSTDSLASPESKLKRSNPATSPQNFLTTPEPSLETQKTLSTYQEDAAIDTAVQPTSTSGTTIDLLGSTPRRRTRKTFVTEGSDCGQRRAKRLVSPNRTISPQPCEVVTQAVSSSRSRDQGHTERKEGHTVDIQPFIPSPSAQSISKHRSEPSNSHTLASESSCEVEDQIHFTVGASASKRRYVPLVNSGVVDNYFSPDVQVVSCIVDRFQDSSSLFPICVHTFWQPACKQ
ncbi:hypothetical protein PHET_07642 [Paragonimus heterotremus]|uniref:Uncharacterized protein n=1 Tax=Paragonimus heterotremus TaxID=100268 RepID=A0A8J4SVM2_9TREM|nr:hypothetical protein PHET_07642 [Paragonimus heterotremus]